MTTRLCIFFVLVMGYTSLAQQPPVVSGAPAAKASPPSAPLLRAAPDFSRWTISYQYSDDNKKGAAAPAKPIAPDHRLRMVLTTKTKTILHEEQTDISGLVFNIWYNGTTQFVRRPNESTWYQTDQDLPSGHRIDTIRGPLPPSGFRGMELVTAANYAGTIAYGSGHCFVFVPGGASKLDLSDVDKQKSALEAQPTLAYVDADSRLPVAVRGDGETRIYRFSDPPSEMQTLPGDLSNQLTKGEETRKRLEQPAPRPY